MIPIFSNSLGAEEINRVTETFKTRWLGKGGQCEDFEKEFARHLKVNKTLLLNNCTAAIYVGLRTLGIGPGDEVIISTINFVACAGAVVEMGATPVFADVDPHTLNILPEEIERLKTKHTKAVFILHYGGHPCPMDDIRAACGSGVAILEDSANSVSSSYNGKMCGTIGDAGFWSFDAMKILVMVDGGGLYLKDEDKYEMAGVYRYLGLAPKTTSGSDALALNKQRWWEYDLAATAGRFISNDVLASIGREQLKKLPAFIERRKQVWDYYQSRFENIAGLQRPPEPLAGAVSSYYLYWIKVATHQRDGLAAHLAADGIYSTFRYFPLHQVRYFGQNVSLPKAEAIGVNTLNLPLHQNLSDADIEKIVDSVKKFLI